MICYDYSFISFIRKENGSFGRIAETGRGRPEETTLMMEERGV